MTSCGADAGVLSAVHVVERSPLLSVHIQAGLRTRHIQLYTQSGHPQRPRRRFPQSVGGRIQTLVRVSTQRCSQATSTCLHLPRRRAKPGRCAVREPATLPSSSKRTAAGRGFLQQILCHDVQARRRPTLQGLLGYQNFTRWAEKTASFFQCNNFVYS